jgi:ATP-dependent exoDNAse (exonuclease V) beta subunit
MPTNAWDELSLIQHGCIDASAGTGKTHTIVELVMRILCNPQQNLWRRPIDLSEILIVTYTEKATEELRVRIRVRIEEELRKSKNGNTAHLTRNLMLFDRAAIFTIHGFCNRFLSTHSFESKSPFDIAQGDASAMASAAARSVLLGPFAKKYAENGEALSQVLRNWNVKSVGMLQELLEQTIQSYMPNSADVLRPKLCEPEIIEACRNIRETFGVQAKQIAAAWKTYAESLGARKNSIAKADALSFLLGMPELDTVQNIIAYLSTVSGWQKMVIDTPHKYLLPFVTKDSD